MNDREEARLTWSLALLIFALLIRILAPFIVSIYYRMFWVGTAKVLMILAIAWFLVCLTSLARGLRISRLRQARMPERIALTELFTWLAQGLWIIIALLLILSLAGVDLTTAVTGLGIGGVAIAFAAQRTIENLFGAIMVITVQPIRVGDFCQAGNVEGTVEKIGLRSTSIRTLNRTLVAIPNGQLSAMSVENLAHRDKFLFRHTFRLGYETTGEQLHHVLAEVQKMLSEHPLVEPATHRTRFVRFGDFSLDLEVFAYVLTPDWVSFLAVQEELLFRMMEFIEVSGSRLALPRLCISSNIQSGTPAPASGVSPEKAGG